MILNFLFAFDKNYNTQASVSIYSLLENLENKANIYVILDKSNNNLLFPQELRSHRNLNKLIIKEIDIDSPKNDGKNHLDLCCGNGRLIR